MSQIELRYDVLLEQMQEVKQSDGSISYGRNGNKKHATLVIMSGDSLRAATNRLEDANPGWWATVITLTTENF